MQILLSLDLVPQSVKQSLPPLQLNTLCHDAFGISQMRHLYFSYIIVYISAKCQRKSFTGGPQFRALSQSDHTFVNFIIVYTYV